MGRNPEEVTDEASNVAILKPDHPLFQWPNRITEKDFAGWVEERGSKWMQSWDPKYEALLETHDAGQSPQKGGLLLCALRKRRLHLQRLGLLPAAPRGRPRGVSYLCEPVEPPEESRPLTYGAGPAEILCPGDSAFGRPAGSMTLMRAIPTRLAVILCAALASSTGCSRHTIAASREEPPTVAVAKASTEDLSHGIVLTAEFRPFQEVDVMAKVAGYIKEIKVDVGDRVTQGQLLAMLEVPEMARRPAHGRCERRARPGRGRPRPRRTAPRRIRASDRPPVLRAPRQPSTARSPA